MLSKKAVESVTASFPFLDEMELHSELSIIYSRREFRHGVEQFLTFSEIESETFLNFS